MAADPAAASLATAATTPAPGWYGKLITLGDFASRRLPGSVQQALDQWLSEVVDVSRTQLGDEWLQRYLDAPLQRFVLGPGVVPPGSGGPWWLGVLMPSCDNVGRYFPLLVLQSRTALPMGSEALDHLDLWWQRAGEAALQTLADEVDVERFDRALAALPAWPAPPPSPPWAAAWAVPGDAGLGRAGAANVAAEALVPEGCALGTLVSQWAAAEWTQRLQGASLWWSWRPQGGESTCRVVSGLPSGEAFAAML